MKRFLSLVAAFALLIGVVALPEQGASAPAYRKNGWSTRVTTTVAAVRQGDRVTFRVRVSASRERRGRVRLVILNPNGRQVFQKVWRPRAFAANTPRTFKTIWSVRATQRLGTYKVRVAVLRADLGKRFHLSPPTAAVRVVKKPTAPPPPRTVLFSEDFTGATMTRFTKRFDWSVVDLNRDDDTWQGHHNEMCEGPTTERTLHHGPISNTKPGAEFWLCGPGGAETDHLMTSNGSNRTFGVTAFSPKRAFANANRVCWDVNLTESPGRRLWWEVQLVPAGAVANAPSLASRGLLVNGVDFERGTAALAWGQGMDGTFMKRPWPAKAVVFDFTEELVRVWRGQSLAFSGGNASAPGVRYVTQDRAKRAHHCMVDTGNGTIRLRQERPGRATYVRTVQASFPARFRVIFSAQNYNAGKDGTASNATWHWDNLLVEGSG